MRMVLKKNPLPAMFKTSFRYYQEFQLDPTLISPAPYTFSANGLYDPNITGIGHQPRGFDQLMSLYDHFVVVGVKARFEFENRCNCASAVSVVVHDSSSTLTDVEDIGEYKVAKHVTVGGENGTNAHSTIKSITMKLNPNKFLGRSKPLSDSQLKGSTFANPVEQAFFSIYQWPVNNVGIIDPPAAQCRVWLDYTAVLIEPKLPSKS